MHSVQTLAAQEPQVSRQPRQTVCSQEGQVVRQELHSLTSQRSQRPVQSPQ